MWTEFRSSADTLASVSNIKVETEQPNSSKPSISRTRVFRDALHRWIDAFKQPVLEEEKIRNYLRRLGQDMDQNIIHIVFAGDPRKHRCILGEVRRGVKGLLSKTASSRLVKIHEWRNSYFQDPSVFCYSASIAGDDDGNDGTSPLSPKKIESMIELKEKQKKKKKKKIGESSLDYNSLDGTDEKSSLGVDDSVRGVASTRRNNVPAKGHLKRLCDRINDIIRLYAAKLENETKSTPRRTFIRFVVSEIGALILLASLKHELSPSSLAKGKGDVKNIEGASEEESTLVQKPIPLSLRCLGAVNVVLFVDQTKQWQNQEAKTKIRDAGEKGGKQRLIEDFKSLAKKFGKMRKERVWEVLPKPFEFLEGNPEFLERMERTKELKNRRNKMSSWITFHIETVASANRSATTPRTATESGNEKKTVMKGEQQAEQKQLLDSVQDARTFLEEFGFAICLFEDPIKWNKRYLFRPLAYDSLSPLESFSSLKAKLAPKSGVQKWFENWKSGWESTVPLRSASPDISLHRSLALQGRPSPSSSMSVFGEVEADNNTLRRLVLNRDCLILGYDEDSKECVYEVALHLAQFLLPLKGESIRRNSNSGKDSKGRYQQQPKGGQGQDDPNERKFDPRIILIDLDKNEADPGIFQSQSPPVAVVMTPELYAFIDFFQDYRQHHRSAGRDGDPNDGLSNQKGGLPHKMGKKNRQKLRSSTTPGSWLGFHGPPPSLLEKIKLLFTPEYLNHKTLLEAILNELKRRALRRKIREMKPRRVVPSQAQNQQRANGLHRPNSCLVFKNKGLGSHFQEQDGKESQRSLPSSSLRSSPSSGPQLLATHVLVNPKVWREKKLRGIAIGLLPTDNWDSKWSHSLGTLDSLLEKIDTDNWRNGRSLSDDILTALTQRERKRRKMMWQLVQPRSRVEVLSRFEVERPLLGVKVVSRKDFPDNVKLGRGGRMHDRMHANTTKILKKPSPIIENLEQNGGRCLSACWEAMVCGNGKSGKIHPEEMEKKETANRHEDEALPMSNRNDSSSLRKRNHKTSGPQAKSKGSTKARSSPKSSKDKKRASVHGPWMTRKEKAGTTEIDTKHKLGSREGKGGRMEHEEGYEGGLTFFDSSNKVQTGDTSSETDAGYWPAFGHTNLVAVRYDYDEDIFLNPSSERLGNCGRFEEKVFTQAQVLLPPSDEEMLLFIKPLFERGTPTSVKEKVEDLLSKSMHILGIDAASAKNGFVLGTITAMEAYQPADFVLYSDKYLNVLPVVEKVVPVRPQCPRHMDIWEDFRRCFHTTERIQAGVVEYMGCAGVSRGFATLQMSVFLNLSKDRAFHLKTLEGKDEKEQNGRPGKAKREEIPPCIFCLNIKAPSLSHHQGGEHEDEVHRQRSDRLKSNDTSVFLRNQDDSGAVSERICARIFVPDENWSVRRLDASLRVSQAFLPEISGALRFNHLLSPGDAGERNHGGESSDGQVEVWNTRKLEDELRKLAQWNSRSKELDKKFAMAPLPLLLLLHTDDDGVSAYDTSFNSAPTDTAATKIGSVNAHAHSVFRFVAKCMRKAIDSPRCRFATLNIRRNMIVNLKNYQSIAQLLPCNGSTVPPLLYAFSWPKEEDKEEDWKGNRQDLMAPDWTSEYNIWQNPYNLAELLGQYLGFDEEEKWRVVQEMKNTYDLSDTMVLGKFTPSRNLFYWLLLHFFYGDVCRSQLEHCLGLKGKSGKSGTADVMSALDAVRVVLLSYTANEAIKTALYYSDVDELQGIGDAEVKACLFAALLPMFEEEDTAFSRLFGDLLASNSSLPPELHAKMTRNYNRRSSSRRCCGESCFCSCSVCCCDSTSELDTSNEDGFLDEDNLTEIESVQDVLVRQIDEVVGWYMRDKDVHPYIEHIIGLATSTKHGTSSTKNAQNNNTFRKLSLAFLYVISVRHMLQRLERLGEPAAKTPEWSKARSACLTWMLRELSRRLQRRVLKLTNRNSSAYIKPPTHPAHNLIVGLMLVFSIFIIPILPLIQYSKAKEIDNGREQETNYRKTCLQMILSIISFSLVCASLFSVVAFVSLDEDSEITYIEGFGPLILVYTAFFMNSSGLTIFRDPYEGEDFQPDNLKFTVQLFEKMRISRLRQIGSFSESLLLADGGEDVGGGTILTSFQLETTKSFYKWVSENDCVSRACCAKSNWLSVILSVSAGVVIGILPTVVRSLRGHPPTGDTSFFGLLIFLLYPLVTIPISSLLIYCLNKWIKRAVLALWQFSAFLDMTSVKGSLRYDLSFIFPTDNLEHMLEWLRFRRTAHRKIASELTEIFPMEVMIGPLVTLTLFMAITVFANSLMNDIDDAYSIVGFVLLLVLTFYTLAILGIAAYANMTLNEEVIAALTRQKFERSKSIEEVAPGSLWNSGYRSTVASTLDGEDKDDDDDDDDDSRNSVNNHSSHAKKNNAALLPTKIGDYKLPRAQENVLRLQEVVNSAFTVQLLIHAIDSSIERIRNGKEGLYLKVFGINITFALLLSAASVLGAGMSGAIAQFSDG